MRLLWPDKATSSNFSHHLTCFPRSAIGCVEARPSKASIEATPMSDRPHFKIGYIKMNKINDDYNHSEDDDLGSEGRTFRIPLNWFRDPSTVIGEERIDRL